MNRTPTVVSPPRPPAVPDWASHGTVGRLASATVADAADLPADALSAAVADAYADVLSRSAHPVRFWNFLPGINDPVDGDQTRYMAFNAGRFAAFAARPHARAATASAVGHGGRDLVVHCLWTDVPCTPVDNPAQVRPDRYSARYGRRPPCFARAATLGRRLFVGGTASVVGEDSTCPGDLPGQIADLVRNLGLVTAAAWPEPERMGWLTHVRAYHPIGVEPFAIVDQLWDVTTAQVETVVADLCRPELLVEVEAYGERPA